MDIVFGFFFFGGFRFFFQRNSRGAVPLGSLDIWPLREIFFLSLVEKLYVVVSETPFPSACLRLVTPPPKPMGFLGHFLGGVTVHPGPPWPPPLFPPPPQQTQQKTPTTEQKKQTQPPKQRAHPPWKKGHPTTSGATVFFPSPAGFGNHMVGVFFLFPMGVIFVEGVFLFFTLPHIGEQLAAGGKQLPHHKINETQTIKQLQPISTLFPLLLSPSALSHKKKTKTNNKTPNKTPPKKKKQIPNSQQTQTQTTATQKKAPKQPLPQNTLQIGLPTQKQPNQTFLPLPKHNKKQKKPKKKTIVFPQNTKQPPNQHPEANQQKTPPKPNHPFLSKHTPKKPTGGKKHHTKKENKGQGRLPLSLRIVGPQCWWGGKKSCSPFLVC